MVWSDIRLSRYFKGVCIIVTSILVILGYIGTRSLNLSPYSLPLVNKYIHSNLNNLFATKDKSSPSTHGKKAPRLGLKAANRPMRQHPFHTPISLPPTVSKSSSLVKTLLWKHGQVYRNFRRRPLLVDVTEDFLSGRPTGTKHQLLNPPDNLTHIILWYNKPYWIDLQEVNRCLKTCFYKNCKSVVNVTLIRQSSAVIFCMTSYGIEKTPPLHSWERPVDQAWVFFAMESPRHININRLPIWEKSLNWSMNYRLDSDIILPYGYLTTRKIRPVRNYSEIFRTKIRFAAWVVSNCNAVSLRMKFVEKMIQHGLEVDVYGRCGQNLTMDPLEMINKRYKFYLGFENSFCSDYITEKFFRYYNLNTIVVVRGGADYKRLLPNGTYINTADFKSFKGLVNYLKQVGSNETLYTNYLKRKDCYKAFSSITRTCPSFCAFCRKLNNLNIHRKVYETVPDYIDTCLLTDPIDLYSMDS